MSIVDKSDLLVSSDHNSLYQPAMAYPDSQWPKKVTAKANNIEDSDRLCSLFNNKTWKNLNKSGFDKVKHYKPKETFLHFMSVTGNVFKNRKHKYEEINRFGKGDITQYLTGIDVKEIVRSGVYFVKILEIFFLRKSRIQSI